MTDSLRYEHKSTAEADVAPQFPSLVLSGKVVEQTEVDEESFRLSSIANSTLAQCHEAQRSGLSKLIIGLHVALDLQRAPHPHRLDTLKDLFTALLMKYTEGGTIEDLDKAIQIGFEIRVLQEDPNFEDSNHKLREVAEMRKAEEAYLMQSLAKFRTSFRQSFEISKLDTAISQLRSALPLRSGLDAKRSAPLSSLGLALMTRFSRTRELRDVDEALLLFHEALEMSHGTPLDLGNNLCVALLAKSHAITDFQEFENAVAWRSHMVKLETIADGVSASLFEGYEREVEDGQVPLKGTDSDSS